MSRAEDFLNSYGEKQSKAAKFLDDYKPPKRTAEVYLEAKKPVKSPAEAFLEAKQPKKDYEYALAPDEVAHEKGAQPIMGPITGGLVGGWAAKPLKMLAGLTAWQGASDVATAGGEKAAQAIGSQGKPELGAAVGTGIQMIPEMVMGAMVAKPAMKAAPKLLTGIKSLFTKKPKGLELSPAWKHDSGLLESVTEHGPWKMQQQGKVSGFIDQNNKFISPKEVEAMIKQETPFSFVKRPKGEVLPKVTPEPKPSFFDDVKALWRRVGPTQERTQLNKIAPEVEKKFQIATRQYQTNLGRIKEKYIAPHAKLDLTDAEKLAIRDFMDKGTKSAALSPRAEAAAKDLLKAYRAEGMLAQNAKLKVNIGSEFERPFYRRKNLGRYPNIPDKKAYESPEVQKQQIEYWMKQKNPLNPDKTLVESEAEGKAILDEMLGKSPNTFTDFSPYKGTRKVQSLEQSRVYDLLHKESDPIKTMSEHLDKGLRRIENIKQFGQQNEKITPLLQEMQKQGKDVDYVTNILTRELKGLPDKKGQQAGKTVRQVTSMMDLQLSAILNSHQGLTGATIRSGSPKIAASSLKDAMTKEGWAWARKSGVIDNKQVQEYFDMITAADKTALGKASDFYSKIHLFKPSETFNFVIASNAGKRYVQEKLVPAFLKNSGSQKLKEELLSFGLNPEFVLKTGGKLSESQLLKASNQFASETIFALRPTDLPQAAKQSELGKLAYRYMGFPVQQMNLVAKSIPKHPIGATVGTAASAGLTYGANEFRKMLTGKKDTQKKTDVQKVVSAIAMSGALGKYGDAALNSMTSRRGVAEAFSPVILSKPSRLAYEAINEPKKLPKSLVSMFAPYGQITSRVLPPFEPEPKNRKRPTRSRKKK